MFRFRSLALASALGLALPVAAQQPPQGPDEISCPAIDPGLSGPSILSDDDAGTSLGRFSEIDRLAREGCATKPLLRAWHDARERLAPFTTEPAADWRSVAAAQARALPVVSPAASKGMAVADSSDWASIGPWNQGGRVRSLAIDPRDENVLYAAAASGGVWKTTDAGITWTPLTDTLDTLSSGAVTIDPTSPDTVWYGSGEWTANIDALAGAGIWKSTNAGATWKKTSAIVTNPTRISAMVVVPSSPVVVLAGTSKGVYRTTDGGTSWSRALDGDISDVVLEAGSTTNVWAAIGTTFGNAKNGVYRSTDGGKNFTKLGGGLPLTCGRIELGLSTSPSAPTTAYVSCADPLAGNLVGVWKTTDAVSFTKTSAPQFCAQQCWYNNVVSLDPANPDNVFLGGLDVYKSSNGGTSFSKLTSWSAPSSASNYVHADQHAILVSPTGVTWVGCDGGVFRSTDGGTSWQDRSLGLVTSQFYSVAQHPTDPNPVIGGLQDNGTQRYTGAADSWRESFGGDGGYTAVDQQNPTVMYCEYVYLDIHKSQNGGLSFSNGSSTTGIPGTGTQDSRALFIAPFTIDPARSSRLMAGTYKVYLSTTSASSWTSISPDITVSTSSSVSALAFAPSDPNIGWAGTENGRLWVTTNLGTSATWTEVTKAPLPGRYIKRILVDPTNAQIVYIAVSGTGAGHVYKTIDGGATFTDISGSLPDAATNGLALDPTSTNRLWVGNDVGVFYTENNGASWARYGTGFPMVRVDELIFQAPLRRLRAGTHGRGVWEVSADLAPPVAPTAAFDFSPAAPMAGTAVSFTDASTGTPTAWSWNFGDGTSSTSQNPTHTYAAAGSYTVTLIVSNAGGSNSTTRSVTVAPVSVNYLPKLSVPGQARATGSGGANFRTSFWATNPSNVSTLVRLLYFPGEGFGTGGAVTQKDLTIGPLQSVSWSDVLTDLLGASSNTSGTIVVAVAEGKPTPLVTSRTYNLTSDGKTYGQYIPAVAIPTTGSGSPTTAGIAGLAGDTASRSNVGVVNLTALTIHATVTVEDPTGAATSTTVTKTLAPWSSSQIGAISSLPLFGVAVEADGAVFAYASKLDNATSDPIFVPASLVAKTRQWIDGMASVAGANNTFFKSNLVLESGASAAANVMLTFRNKATGESTGPMTVSLAAGETKLWNDALADIFGLTGVSGVLTVESDTAVIAWARTYNDLTVAGGTGSYGQFIPAFGDADLVGSTGAILQGLSQSTDATSGFRTNMGFANTGTGEATVTVTLRKKDGTAAGASKSWTLGAGEAKQVNRIVEDMLGAGASLTDGYAVVTVSTGARVYAWASMVDNKSSDPTFIRPIPAP